MRLPFAPLLVALALGGSAAAALATAGGAAAAASHKPQCADRFSATRNRANPLMLSAAPGANPLGSVSGLFVDGPAHGAAAGAIAALLGHNPSSYSEKESWAQFAGQVASELPSHASVAGEVLALEKIAAEPEVQRISSYSQGGTPTGIYSQTQKLFCHNFQADPGAVPIINTYFLHATLGGCATKRQIRAYMPLFERRVNAVAQGTGHRPVVFLLETDALGSSSCMSRKGSLGAWEKALGYEVHKLGSLPHAVTYVEAGYSDGNSPAYTARALRKAGIRQIRGFYTNDTHLNWTINEIRWGEAVARKLGGHVHFIVNTAQNGNGPLIPRNRVKSGNEVLCNPPGRALGPQPTTSTGFPPVDAFLWTSVPGNSSGTCNGGPAAGTFWDARGAQLATAANDRLGPTYPSRPY